MLNKQALQLLLEALREDERALRDQYMVLRGRIMQLEELIAEQTKEDEHGRAEAQPSGSTVEQTEER